MSTERDPPRLSEGGEGIPPALTRALGAARARIPGEAVLSAVAARLPPGPPGGGGPSGDGTAGQGTSGHNTGGAVGSGASSPGPGASVPIAAAPSVWSGVFLGAVLGVLVGGGSLLVPVSGPAPGVPAAAASASVAAATGDPASASSPVPATSAEPGRPADAPSGGSSPAPLAPGSALPDSPSPAPADSPSPAPADSPSASPAETEADYLRRAHAQIASSPSQALSLAEAHPLRYPDGKLGQEREMIVIGALSALGRTSEAEARARAFLTRFPDSAHRRRLEVLVPSLAEAGR